MVRKWMDGMTVKVGVTGRGMQFVVPWIFCTTEISDEWHGGGALWIRGESSRRREEAGSPELD